MCFDLHSRPRDMAFAKKAYLAIKTAHPDIAATHEAQSLPWTAQPFTEGCAACWKLGRYSCGDQ